MMNFATLKGLTIPEGVVKKITRASDGLVLWKKGIDRYGVTTLKFNLITDDNSYADKIYLNIYKDDTSPTSIYLNNSLVTTSTTQGKNDIYLFDVTTEELTTISENEYIVQIVSQGTYYLRAAEYIGGDNMYGNYVSPCIYASKTWFVTMSSASNGMNTIKTNVNYCELDNMCPTLSDSAFQTCTIETLILPPNFTAFLDVDNRNSAKPNAIYESVYVKNIDAWFNVTKSPAAIRYKNLYANDFLVNGSYTIPNGTTTIKDNMFAGWLGLTSVSIPTSVTSIGHSAFYGCIGLTSVVIPNSVVTIGANAFENCNNLTSVVIGASVTTIGDGVFLEAVVLTVIVIPSSVTSIGNHVFGAMGNNCNLRAITFMHTTAHSLTLGSHLFYNKSAYDLTVNHYGNETVLNYDYASDNATPNFVDMR